MFALNSTAAVLQQKDCKIAEQDQKLNYQDALIKHQQELLAGQHAEIATLHKKVDELKGYIASLQGRLFDQVAELAALKCKTLEEAAPLTVLESSVQTDTISLKDAQVQTMAAYVDYAWDMTEQFIMQVLTVRRELCQEIRRVQAELADMDAELDGIEICQTILLSRSLQLEPTNTGEQVTAKSAEKKRKDKKSKAELEAEKQAKMQADLKVHKEAVRARAEQERREKNKKQAERKAILTAPRVQPGHALPGHDNPEARANEVARRVEEMKRAKEFNVFHTKMFEFYQMRACPTYTLPFSKENSRLLALYTVECLGVSGLQLNACTFSETFRLEPECGREHVVSLCKSPLVNGATIMTWLDHEPFYKACHAFFGLEYPSANLDDSAFILEQFNKIKDDPLLKVVELEERTGDIDWQDLQLFQMRVPEGRKITVCMLSVIVWFKTGKLEHTAKIMLQPHTT